jgi:uncharacterized membrane protein YphA (DoxX/SURF4 family)
MTYLIALKDQRVTFYPPDDNVYAVSIPTYLNWKDKPSYPPRTLVKENDLNTYVVPIVEASLFELSLGAKIAIGIFSFCVASVLVMLLAIFIIKKKTK